MPVRREYKGRVVTRISREPAGVQLTFANRQPGERHEKVIVTQAEWKLHGIERYEPTPVDRTSQGK